jgi:hypothetical protein
MALAAAPASTGGFSIGGPSQAVVVADPQVGLAGWVPAPAIPGVSELSMAAGYGSSGTAPNDAVVSPSWYAANKFLGPAPTNTPATVALVMVLTVLMAPLAFIFSIVGLAKASRIQRDGFAPIGRRRAAWGLALSTLFLIAAPIGVSIGLPMLQHQQELALEEAAAANAVSDELTVTAVEVPPGEYDRTAFEQSIAVGFTQSPENAPESVTCPDAAGKATGESITCEIMYHEQTHTVTMTFTDDIGTHTLTVDGVVQEEAALPVQ